MAGPEPRRDPQLDRAQVDQIVLHAAALDPTERAAFLNRLAAEAPELLQQARRLLEAATDVSQSFLESPAVDFFETADSREGSALLDIGDPGDERYRMEEVLGAGGMAEVWKAHDLQLDRPVALKLLRTNLPGNTALCLREARAQARVRHRNVLEVYETGELRGRPFISLKYVPGPTFRDLGDDLSLEQQIGLLIQVAEGLHAAHVTGLVHRDVKPSNVLVEELDDGSLHAWVTDFGIASVLRGDKVDTADALVGTAHYLPPECLQRGGLVDRRGDVWSFGVTMYRLFTGVFPFEHTLVPTLLLQIRDTPPRPPRDLIPSLPEDLQAIVLKCLAKDPGERYPSALAVADDLRRFLHGDVVEAHTATRAYRLARFALRNKRMLTFGGIAAVLLALSLGVAAVLGVQAVRANRQLELRQGQAEDLIRFMLLDLRKKLEPLGRLEYLDDVDAQAMDYFSSVPIENLSGEELARYATSLNQIGEVRMQRGQWREASQAFAEALRLSRDLTTRFPGDGERLFDLGQSSFWVGYVDWELGKTESALEAFRRYLDISQQLVVMDPDRLAWRMELAYAHSNLGTVRFDLGELAAAEQQYRTSLEIRQGLMALAPGDSELMIGVARAHNSLATVLGALGRSEESKLHLGRDLELKQQLVEENPGHATFRDALAVSHNYLGIWAAVNGAWPAARQHLDIAARLHRELWQSDPGNADLRYKLALDRGALGHVLVGLGAMESGLEELAWSRATLEALVGEGASSQHWRRDLGGILNYHALALLEKGDLSAAAAAAEVALSSLEILRTSEKPDRVAALRISESHRILGDVAQRRGDLARARDRWQEAARWVAPFEKGADVRFFAPRALALSRLGETKAAAHLLERLSAARFCSPMYRELCAEQPPDEMEAR